MNGRFSADASIDHHSERVAGAVAANVQTSQRTKAMLQTSMPTRTSASAFMICVICTLLSTGCAFSKNLWSKSSLQNSAVTTPSAISPDTTKPDCAVPNTQATPKELTAYPVAPQATANQALVNNGTLQQPAMQQQIMQQPGMQQPGMQQPGMQQQQIMQQPGIQQQTQPTTAFVQQPFTQPPAQPMAQAPVVGTAPQGQLPPVQSQVVQPQTAQVMTAEVASSPQPLEVMEANAQKLPAAMLSPAPNHPKEASGADMTATPASTLRAQARAGSAMSPNCPPGMVPSYSHIADVITPPEKLAECEKQVFEMNQRLTELQFDTLRAKLTMEQMAEQQKKLLIDNEQLRRRAEMADKRYIEELDSLSEIVGDVVSQAGSGGKSTSSLKPSRGTNPLRPVPQSAAGQSL